jgi:polyribonucleotide nucleotidyltransferase
VLKQALLQARDARLQILDVMEATIAAPRDDVKGTAPKIVSFEIPLDKIGEVIGPKGKVINTITAETGADVSVSDDGVVGTVTIGSRESDSVAEARRRIELILDPPMAELGAVYEGKVVNITKFGAFVNVLPGKDGLLHISKLGRGKRIDRVEDVLNLGDEVSVRVDDIDNAGKLSLSLVGDDDSAEGGGDGDGASAPRRDSAPDREAVSVGASGGNGEGRETVSFEDSWEDTAKSEFGDLGPDDAGRGERSGGGGGGGGGRRGGRRGGGGGRR